MSKAKVLIVLLFILLGAFFSSNLLSSSQQIIKAETKSELAPGEVRVTKKVTPVDGMVNQWDVTVDLEAKNHFPPPSQDIFIALDVSGSMLGIVSSTGKTRLEMLKETAKTFVTEVLQDGYDNRVGFLLFGREVNDIVSYKTSSQRDELLAYIDSISVKTGDGTNIQLALRKTAEEMNDPSNARLTGVSGGEVSRSMILLSDGVPTDSALPVDEKWMIPYTNNKVNMDFFGVYNNKIIQYETIDSIDAFDYDKIVPYQGSAGSYRFRMINGFGFVAPPMTSDNITPEVKLQYPELINNEVYRFFNHSNSTIAESKLIKDMAFSKDTSKKLLDEIYTIGIDLSLTSSSEDVVQVAEKTLKEVATNGNNYNADTDEVEGILKEISEKMIYTAQQSSYTEKIVEGFEIEGTLTNTNVSQGSITYNSATNEIFWNAGTLATPIPSNKEHMKASMTYRVSANNNVLKPGIITSDYANIAGKSTVIGAIICLNT
ncbi:vWA domain-containing protein [Enterococcus termitis]